MSPVPNFYFRSLVNETDMLWKLLVSIIFLISFLAVQKYLPYPYMDEIFHVPQTLQYIVYRDFTQWDPKITTPPGSYYIGFAWSFICGHSVAALRSVNLVAIMILLITQPIQVAAFPSLAFYSNLYYTDVWSALLVITALSRRNSADAVSALLFFFSSWMRQTNIIWLGLGAAFAVLRNNEISDDLKVTGLFKTKVIAQLVKRALDVISSVSYLVIVSFGLFIYFNGGITLGDKSNHEVTLHGAQFLYFSLFLSAFSAPSAADWALRKKGSVQHLYLVPLEITAIWYIIRKSTIVHPFISADNRHFTFYIWRRFITPFNGSAIVPIYWASWRWFTSTLNLCSLQTWAYVLAVLAVLIPTPLMEPRYYVVPYLVWRRFIYKKRVTILEIVWYVAIEIATVSAFVFTKTHFMW